MSSAGTISNVPVIAVDGPSGVGKGTICARLAAATRFHLLDSGALYRLVAFVAAQAAVDLSDAPELAKLAAAMPVSFSGGDEHEPVRALLDGVDVGQHIRTNECGVRASIVAAHAAVRSALVDLQHGMRRAPGLVADGRDMGTVIFPDATVKIFLDASPEVRAIRRHKQLMDKGIGVSLAHLFDEIVERDRRDRSRAVAPLRPADDAVVIDTTELGIDDVMSQVVASVRARGIVANCD